MNTASTTALYLYRSEAFAEDLPEWQEQAAAASWLPANAPPLSTLSVALLSALPLGAAMLGVAASAWGWMA